MDKLSKEQRSENMRRVPQRNTRPELMVRKLLHRLGYRFRLHAKKLPGNPDIVLPKYRAVVFVHGCFWHGHDCRRGKLPETRKEFWKKKIDGNRDRDARTADALNTIGYRVAVVWECELKDVKKLESRLKAFLPKESDRNAAIETR